MNPVMPLSKSPMRLSHLLLHRLPNLVIGNHTYNLCLIRHTSEHVQHFSIPTNKSEFGIRKVLFLGKFLYQDTGLTQVVPWETREEVMSHLEMQSAMHE